MKTLFSLLVLVSTVCRATENQIEYAYGRGTPRSAVDAGTGSDREGDRGPAWSADLLHEESNHVYLGVGGGQFHSDDRVSGTFVPQANSITVGKCAASRRSRIRQNAGQLPLIRILANAATADLRTAS